MNGHAYRTSATIADAMGTFEGSNPNADAMLRVIRNTCRRRHDRCRVRAGGMLSAAKQSWTRR